MNDYYLVRINLNPCVEEECDIVAALLADVGFESFVPDEKGVSAYIRKELFDKPATSSALAAYPFNGELQMEEAELIQGQDWNSEWEKHYFQPIVVGDRCVVHSSFHKEYPKAEYEIVVDPRMAFGTGHHETTSLMLERLLSYPLEECKLLDMGTGTGILAILAAMRGAVHVVGVEIDEPAYLNAVDNAGINGVDLDLRLGGVETVTECAYFDYVLANINRNIIIADIDKYARSLRQGGIMTLSGFYVEDIPFVEEAGKKCGLAPVAFFEKRRWACLCLEKGGQV
ncbi:MAG TPA: 50S ribosomal protein L11 methyltransferase [Candidatus Limisoma intestinavium]|uniref:50S ribosomal protein L11 methyltransferase n=1 Tax=Candidatus Limisoma intestinavium TaxID=2840856 RepID=A0A9D1IKS7_9BACT|nr:50S ribosomal protein L11 methyltransferase [Candidatus Limisoma intestinavium]